MAPSGLLRRAYHGSGLASVRAAGPDAWLIILARSARMFAYGGAGGVVLALFLAELGTPDPRIGLFMTLSLLGDVLLSLALSLVADGGRRGHRRRCLLLGSGLMVFSGVVFALSENFWLLLLAAVVGVISISGSDTGPFRAVEESILAELVPPASRADVLAWYSCFTALALSAGSEVTGMIIGVLRASAEGGRGGGEGALLRAYHACFWVYTVVGGISIVASLLLSEKCELKRAEVKTVVSATESDRLLGDEENSEDGSDNNNDDNDQTKQAIDNEASIMGSADGADDIRRHGAAKSLVSVSNTYGSVSSSSSSSSSCTLATKKEQRRSNSNIAMISRDTLSTMAALWFLLMIDSVADGMSTISLTTYFLDLKFGQKNGGSPGGGDGLSKSTIADAISAAYFLAAVSCALASPLSRRIGLVNTMVFTHLPSSAAVLLFPLPRTVGPTVALLLVRMWLNNMDQAPRASLIAAVVRPHERTAIMGITVMLRTLATAAGPMITGVLADGGRFWLSFVIAGALRMAYDLGLFAMFVNITLYRHEPPSASTAGGEEAVGEVRRDGPEGRTPGADEERGGAAVSTTRVSRARLGLASR